LETVDRSNISEDRIFTVSNAISVSRLPIAAGIILLHYYNNQSFSWPVAALVVVGIVSDYLDGIIARKFNQVSDLGKALDPICDKIAMAVLFIYVVWLGRIPGWFLGILILRDGIIGWLSIQIKNITGRMPMALFSGKVSINIIVLYWTIAFFAPGAKGVLKAALVASLAIMVFSFIDYIRRYYIIAQQQDFT